MEDLIHDNFVADTRSRERLLSRAIKEEIAQGVADLNVSMNIFCRSTCSRKIHMIKFGNVVNNPVLFVGTFHGLEWITGLVLIKFAHRLIRSVKSHEKMRGIDVASFLRKSGLVIIPCLNPDGVEISLHGAPSAGKYERLVSLASQGNTLSWQSNARGVDLNHNFPAGWRELHRLEAKNGIVKPSATRYGGPRPLSEVESYRLVYLCKRNKFRQVFAFHSQGEEIYWDFGEHVLKKAKVMANILSASSGYKVSRPENLAVGGGFKDWFISEFSRPGFTIEIGKGKNPLPITEFDAIYKKIEEMMLLCFIM